jgi:hypothetical protein
LRGARIALVPLSPAAGGWPELEQRVGAELASVGAVVTIARPDLAPGADPGMVAAIKLVRVDPAHLLVTIAIREPAAAAAAVHKFDLDGNGDALPVARAALLVAEHLHALLQKVLPPAGAAKLQAAVVQAEPPPPAPAPGTIWSAHGGGLFLMGPGGLGGLFGLSAGGSVALARPGAVVEPYLSFDVGGSLNAASTSAAPGSARVRMLLPRAELGVGFNPDGRLSPGLGVDAGMLLAWSSAEAKMPFEAREDAARAAFVGARARLALKLWSAARLVLAAGAAIVVPELHVRLGGTDAARFGRPILDGMLAVEWAWAR